MKTWKPDTCGCHVEELYNGTEIIGGGQVLSKCTAHASVADQDLYGVLYANPDGENKRKNHLMGRLQQFAELVQTNPEGQIEFKNNVVNWSYNENRVLEVSITGLTQTKKNQAQSWCDTNFGAGKIIII